jgi:hypothetical protein
MAVTITVKIAVFYTVSCVLWQILDDIPENYAASIFRVV